VLIVFGGLPGVGKSTISNTVARQLGSVYLRIDTIEQALRNSGFEKVYAQGYMIAYSIAADNLSCGSSVVADSVNPLATTRDAWRAVARTARCDLFEIEVICSDRDEHRRRVETRVADIDGLTLPTWQTVLDRTYEFWDEAGTETLSGNYEHIVIDTAGVSPDQSTATVLSSVWSTTKA